MSREPTLQEPISRRPAGTRTGRATALTAAVALTGVLALAGCSGTNGTDTGSTPPTTASSAPSGTASAPATSSGTGADAAGSSPSSTAPATATTKTTTAATGLPDNAAEYGDAFIRAWGRGDAAAMARMGTDDAIGDLEQLGKKGGPHWERVGQEAGTGQVYLTYRDTANGGRVELQVSNQTASQAREHAVIGVQILEQPIPDDATAYADAFVRAWGAGDEARMKQLATFEVIDTMGQYGLKGGPNWARTAQDSGAGSVFVTYTNSKDGWKLELRVQNETAANAKPQAVAEAKFSH